jgi:hypothetical protein
VVPDRAVCVAIGYPGLWIDRIIARNRCSQTRIAIRLVFFDLQFPHSKFLNPFFFSLWSFFKPGSASSKGPVSFLAASFRISAAVVDLPIFGAREEPLTNDHPEIPEPVLLPAGAHSSPRGKRIINSATIIRVYGNSSREYLRKWVRPNNTIPIYGVP